MENVLIFSLCIIPSLILLWYIYIKDKIQKEPLHLLSLLFIGGVIACCISVLLASSLKNYISFLNHSYTEMNIFQIVFKLLFSIAIVEEGSKWLISYIAVWKNKYFKHIYDPIVYCTFVSLGFATLENFIYGITFIDDGILPLIMRGLISVPNHAVFGVFMGYYLGITKNALGYNKMSQSKKYKLLSLIVPTCLHFLYDLLLIKKNLVMYLIFIIYILVLYVLAYNRIKRLSSVNNNLIKNKDILI